MTLTDDKAMAAVLGHSRTFNRQLRGSVVLEQSISRAPPRGQTLRRSRTLSAAASQRSVPSHPR